MSGAERCAAVVRGLFSSGYRWRVWRGLVPGGGHA